MASRRHHGKTSARLFWSIADFFREYVQAGWETQVIAFERSSRFSGAGHRWTLHCSISYGFYLGADATVMIRGLDRGSCGRLTPRSPELSFFDRVEHDMKKLGYRGQWNLATAHFSQAFASFDKRLRSPADVEREWKVLTRLQFRNDR